MTNGDIDRFVEMIGEKEDVSIRLRDDVQNPTRKLSYRHSGKSYVPFMEVDHGDQVDIYEFEKKSSPDQLKDLLAGWILFSAHARSHYGRFYLVVDKKSGDNYQKIIRDKKLDIVLVRI